MRSTKVLKPARLVWGPEGTGLHWVGLPAKPRGGVRRPTEPSGPGGWQPGRGTSQGGQEVEKEGAFPWSPGVLGLPGAHLVPAEDSVCLQDWKETPRGKAGSPGGGGATAQGNRTAGWTETGLLGGHTDGRRPHPARGGEPGQHTPPAVVFFQHRCLFFWPPGLSRRLRACRMNPPLLEVIFPPFYFI